jgi:hypothetical protein
VGRLKEASHEVAVVESLIFDSCGLGPLPAPVDHEIYKNIRDLTLSDLDYVDTLTHLAALSNNPLGSICSRLTFEINEELLDRDLR